MNVYKFTFGQLFFWRDPTIAASHAVYKFITLRAKKHWSWTTYSVELARTWLHFAHIFIDFISSPFLLKTVFLFIFLRAICLLFFWSLRLAGIFTLFLEILYSTHTFAHTHSHSQRKQCRLFWFLFLFVFIICMRLLASAGGRPLRASSAWTCATLWDYISSKCVLNFAFNVC